MSKEITMLEIEVNEFSEEVECEYLLPIEAVKQYLETDNENIINRFLEKEYVSEDTSQVIDLCIKQNIDYKLIREEITGSYR